MGLKTEETIFKQAYLYSVRIPLDVFPFTAHYKRILLLCLHDFPLIALEVHNGTISFQFSRKFMASQAAENQARYSHHKKKQVRTIGYVLCSNQVE